MDREYSAASGTDRIAGAGAGDNFDALLCRQNADGDRERDRYLAGAGFTSRKGCSRQTARRSVMSMSV